MFKIYRIFGLIPIIYFLTIVHVIKAEDNQNFYKKSSEKIKIVTFLKPIASLIEMVGQEKVDIEVLANNSSCVHNHHLKPSEIKKILDADIIILLDKNFDGKILNKFEIEDKKILYLNNSALKLINTQNRVNWHVWLDIVNANIMINSIYKSLIALKPDEKTYFKENFNLYLKQLQALQNSFKIKILSMKLDKKLLNLSKNLEYLFQNLPYHMVSYFLPPTELKFNDIKNIKSILQKEGYKCLIIDEEQPFDKYSLIFGHEIKVVQLNAEHWEENWKKELKNNLYISTLNSYLDILKQCN